jgi:hypothetical protein
MLEKNVVTSMGRRAKKMAKVARENCKSSTFSGQTLDERNPGQ